MNDSPGETSSPTDGAKALWYVGNCRICGTGTVGVRACGQCRDLTLLCDECDAAWTSANRSTAPRYPQSGDVGCPSCGASLLGPPAHWASRQEIAATGWLAQAIVDGQAVLERGAAFGS